MLKLAGAGIAGAPASVVPLRAPLSGVQVVALRDQWAARDLVVCTQEKVELPRLTTVLLAFLSSDAGIAEPGRQQLKAKRKVYWSTCSLHDGG